MAEGENGGLGATAPAVGHPGVSELSLAGAGAEDDYYDDDDDGYSDDDGGDVPDHLSTAALRSQAGDSAREPASETGLTSERAEADSSWALSTRANRPDDDEHDELLSLDTEARSPLGAGRQPLDRPPTRSRDKLDEVVADLRLKLAKLQSELSGHRSPPHRHMTVTRAQLASVDPGDDGSDSDEAAGKAGTEAVTASVGATRAISGSWKQTHSSSSGEASEAIRPEPARSRPSIGPAEDIAAGAPTTEPASIDDAEAGAGGADHRGKPSSDELEGDGASLLGPGDSAVEGPPLWTTESQAKLTAELHVVRGSGFVGGDGLFDSANDPYVVVSLEGVDGAVGREAKTSVQHGKSSPRWDETVTLDAEALRNRSEARLKLRVMDKDRFTADDPLGQAELRITAPVSDAWTEAEQLVVREGASLTVRWRVITAPGQTNDA